MDQDNVDKLQGRVAGLEQLLMAVLPAIPTDTAQKAIPRIQASLLRSAPEHYAGDVSEQFADEARNVLERGLKTLNMAR